MADIVGVVAFGLHAAHNLICYLNQVQEGPSEREHLKFLLSESMRSLETIEFAYKHSPNEIQTQCALQYDRVFNSNGTIHGYLQLLLDLHQNLTENGIRHRVKELFNRERSSKSTPISWSDSQAVEALLDEVGEALTETSEKEKWMFPWRKGEIQRIIDRIRDYTDSFANLRFRVQDVVGLETLKLATETRDETSENLELARHTTSQLKKMMEGIDAAEIDVLLGWLSQQDPWTKVNKEFSKCKNSLPSWVLDVSLYQQWMAPSSDIREIWAIGAYGIGKTTTAAYVSQHLRKMGLSNILNLQSTIAVFFFNYKLQSQQGLSDVLRCLAKQLIQDSERLRPDKMKEFVAKVKMLKANSIELDEILLDLVQSYSEVVFVLDGIDECGVRSSILDTIGDLLETCPNLKILITSRAGDFVPQDVNQFDITSKEDLIRKAAKSFLSRRMKARSTSKSAIAQVCRGGKMDEVVEAITRSADGKFLFAELHLQGLVNCDTEADVMKRIEKPSMELGDLLEDALQRIQAQFERKSRKRGYEAVKWVLHARRALTVDELSMILTFQEKQGRESEQTVIEGKVIEENTRGLLSIEDSGKTRMFRIHKSFQDYFDKSPAHMEQLFPNGHADIAISCLEYLDRPQIRFPEFVRKRRKTKQDLIEIIKSNPFLQYACIHWGQHVKVAGEDLFLDPYAKFALANFLTDEKAMYAVGLLFIHCNDFFNPTKNSTEYLKRYSVLDPADRPPLSGLHLATMFHLPHTVQHLLDRGFQVDLRSIFDLSPLYLAVAGEDFGMVQLLLRNGADAGHRGIDDLSIIHNAAIKDNPEVINALLDVRIDLLHRPKAQGETPLLSAIKVGALESVKCLLARGADLWLPKSSAYLTAAAKKNHAEIVLLLLKRLDETKPDDTQLSWEKCHAIEAALRNAANEAVRILSEQGADAVRIGIDFIKIALEVAAASGNTIGLVYVLAACKKPEEVINAHHGTTNSLLCIASKNNRIETVRMLLEKRASDDLEAYCQAAAHGHTTIVQLFYERNSIVLNRKNHQGLTALHLASGNGHLETVKWLLNQGAGQSIASKKEGKIALHFAAEKGRDSILDLLLSNRQEEKELLDCKDLRNGCTPLWFAVESKSLSTVQILLQAGASPFKITKLGRNAMHQAARSSYSDIISAIIQAVGPSILHTHTEAWSQTPLHHAIEKQHFMNVVALLDAGSDIEAVNKRGMTPLLYSANRKNKSVFSILLERGGNIAHPDMEGRTTLHVVAQYGNIDWLKLVLSKCGDDLLKVCDGIGATVLHRAVMSGKYNAVETVLLHYLKRRMKDVVIWKRVDGLTASEVALSNGDVDAWELLLEAEKIASREIPIEELERKADG